MELVVPLVTAHVWISVAILAIVETAATPVVQEVLVQEGSAVHPVRLIAADTV